MKKYLLITLLTFLCVWTVKASDTSAKLSYFPVVTGNDIPSASKKLIISKMEQILTQNGYGSLNCTDRFVMLAKCNILQKDIAPTTPPRISQKIEVTFILGDAVENKIYSSTTIELSGIGINETKAWQTAISGIKPANQAYKQMFNEASQKIEYFYSENCESIISQAKTLASTGKSNEAIASLIGVPDICHDCYEKAMVAATEIYQNQIDNEGAALLAKAKNAWSTSPDENGANLALNYLNEISVNSSSFANAESFAETISEKVSSDREREWQLRLRQYKDEKEFREREQVNSNDATMAAIAAARSVAEKWAENQSETKVYLNW
ncbi:MAG: hypothetical protein K2J12_03030 [Muribaculaceae bacterium]|nr:hypothetical protein [Muribaculaceae bacterium]